MPFQEDGVQQDFVQPRLDVRHVTDGQGRKVEITVGYNPLTGAISRLDWVNERPSAATVVLRQPGNAPKVMVAEPASPSFDTALSGWTYGEASIEVRL